MNLPKQTEQSRSRSSYNIYTAPEMALPNIAPGKLALGSLCVALSAFACWIVLSIVGPGEHGEHWAAWDRSIDVAWKIIPVALLLSVVCAIIAAVAPVRSGENSRTRGLIVLLLAGAFTVYVVLMLLNLHIS